ncbi:VOC family protein [Flexivirga alba]|uniref:VOC family protein n=1 Tax=Flexivirga alba TaxID=702742 RepID=A0ABW2AKJ7_9MICO
MSTPIGRLASISLDCPDAERLARFYGSLLGMTEAMSRPDRSLIVLADGSFSVTMMQVDNYTPPVWPDGPQQQQIHLDVCVAELDAAVRSAVDLGAEVALTQPAPDVWRVMLDPAGHPFCLTTHSFCLSPSEGR